MSEPHYAKRNKDDVTFTRWQLDCGLLWMARNDEDVFGWPAYPWQEWYDSGLTVEQAIAEANILLFGRPQGA